MYTCYLFIYGTNSTKKLMVMLNNRITWEQLTTTSNKTVSYIVKHSPEWKPCFV